jgi:hypothetical protein
MLVLLPVAAATGGMGPYVVGKKAIVQLPPLRISKAPVVADDVGTAAASSEVFEG